MNQKEDEKMKRILSLVLTLSLAITCVGCSNSSPKPVIETFCNAMQSFDMNAMATCMENANDVEDPFSNEDLENSFSSGEALNYLKDCVGKMTYEIGETGIDGNEATTTVSFSYTDISPVVTSTLGEYMSQAFALAFSGADESQMADLFTNIFVEQANTVETGSATADVTFHCVKSDSEWKISDFSDEDSSTITDVLTSNMVHAFDGFADDSTDGGTDEAEDIVWHDVPCGQNVELATINICVSSCEERSELTAQYYDPDVAQDGTKFVVFNVDIENITKDTMSFNNSDMTLTDSQGRNYTPYTNASWYFDNTFSYENLAPNIKKSGVLVYNVPSDSDGYYISVQKADTNDGYRLFGQ